jgi:hypothetical protein
LEFLGGVLGGVAIELLDVEFGDLGGLSSRRSGLGWRDVDYLGEGWLLSSQCLIDSSDDGCLDVFFHVAEALVEGVNIFIDLGGSLGTTITVLEEFGLELLILLGKILSSGHVEG